MSEITFESLAAAAARIEAMPEEKKHGLARKSVMWSIERLPGCDDEHIAREQWMDLVNVQRATSQLLQMGRIRRGRLGGYEPVTGMS